MLIWEFQVFKFRGMSIFKKCVKKPRERVQYDSVLLKSATTDMLKDGIVKRGIRMLPVWIEVVSA